MRFPSIHDIREIRKVLDMTQVELSERSGVSQSTIAKVEQGVMNPSYPIAVRLFTVLTEELDKRRGDQRADEISSGAIISIQRDQKVKAASEVMRDSGYSQMPVLDGERVVGSISEHGIMDILRGGMGFDEMGEMRVDEVMEGMFPMVPGETPVSLLTQLVSVHDAVIVSNHGEVSGIVTRSDVLRLMR